VSILEEKYLIEGKLVLNQPLMHLLISKTPLRLSLGGGGTDLPHFYRKYGSHIVTAAIQKYVYVFAKRWFEDGIRISYSKTELVSSVEEIQHPIVREVLRLFGPKKQVEIVSMADLPARSGMGTSASFTVGLLNAIHGVNRSSLDTHSLAEMAFKIQTEILKEAGGKQDQFAAAFGGILSLNIDRDGHVTVRDLALKDEVIEELENNLICFYTGIQRESHGIQKDVVKFAATNSHPNSNSSIEDVLLQTKAISLDVEKALESDNLNELGPLFHMHWMAKRSLSNSISNGIIDKLYERGLSAGATGGKVMGAGGGGFLIFYCENGKKNGLRKEMINSGLKEVKTRFDFQGSRIAANI
jgi:D-glycero-alpha-D-manno-heptose-7-phosphate kinase